MRYIGDVHGKWGRYKTLIRRVPASIQVGDFGVGFIRRNGEPDSNPPYDTMTRNGSHRFIRGNHDNPKVCRRHTQWIADGHIEGDHMFIGGAFSIDRHSRTQDVDWWDDEECTYDQFHKFMDVVEAAKPRVMITHDAPLRVLPFLMNSYHGHDRSRTQQGLQAIWELHQPEVWIFGHHHTSFDMQMDATRFICLNELEHLDL